MKPDTALKSLYVVMAVTLCIVIALFIAATMAFGEDYVNVTGPAAHAKVARP